MILDIVILVVMAAVLILQVHFRRQDDAALRKVHASEISRKDQVINSLIAQIQANAQNQPYYPTLGPAPAAEPEVKWLTDESGLIQFPDYGDDDEIDALAEERI